MLNVSLSNACTNSRKIHAKPTLQPSATVPAPYPELRESVGAVSRKTVPTELVQIVQNPHRQLTQPAAEGKSSYVSVADRIRRFTRLRSRGIYNNNVLRDRRYTGFSGISREGCAQFNGRRGAANFQSAAKAKNKLPCTNSATEKGTMNHYYRPQREQRSAATPPGSQRKKLKPRANERRGELRCPSFEPRP